MKIKANGVEIEVEDTGGDAARPVVLLIMGLGMQLVAWPPDMVQGLVDAGYRVVRFDNRDMGLSQDFSNHGTPNLLWQTFKYRLGLGVDSPYSLHDMAKDGLGVLDALGIARAHIVGASMGGMIAQRVAIAAPERCLSLTSMLSSSGARYLPPPTREVLAVMMSRPKGSDAEALIAHGVRFFQTIGSPGFPLTDEELRAIIAPAVARSVRPTGVLRQIVAIAADGKRAKELAHIQTPTLVIHGKDDKLLPYAHGEDTAKRIKGSQLVGIVGMGHDLPPGVVELILPALLPHLNRI